jgi:copper resistance protein C
MRIAWLAAALLAAASTVWAHAFPDHAEPRVGSTVPPPSEVRIWFDGEIEPVFSTVRVENTDKQRVDKGDARVSPQDGRVLQVSVPPLPSGKYRVIWSVVARDGHRTEGDFPFRIR